MNMQLNQISRHGAYGVLLQDSKILLTQKKSGPYIALWGLPGGAIEFGETPEEALKRELMEETALSATHFELLSIATAIGECEKHGEQYHFHHIGIIYKVFGLELVPGIVPEEEGKWMSIHHINTKILTPFAKQILLKI